MNRVYVKPRINDECLLEQTSLACNTAINFEATEFSPCVDFDVMFAPGVEASCSTNVAKNNTYAFGSCEVNLTEESQIVVLS